MLLHGIKGNAYEDEPPHLNEEGKVKRMGYGKKRLRRTEYGGGFSTHRVCDHTMDLAMATYFNSNRGSVPLPSPFSFHLATVQSDLFP